jgi:hypothetical protein
MAVAKNRAIDDARKKRFVEARQEPLRRELLPPPPRDVEKLLTATTLTRR